jgi:hypothetical protein
VTTDRSRLHGTCLLNGHHAPNDPYAAECPLNPERAQKRSERVRTSWATRRASRMTTRLPRPLPGPRGRDTEGGADGRP